LSAQGGGEGEKVEEEVLVVVVIGEDGGVRF